MKLTKKGYLIAIDIDDTLAYNTDIFDTKAISLLKEIKDYNYVILTTGRPFRGTVKIYNELNLNTPVINYNGSLIHIPNDPTFPKFMNTVKKEHIIDIYENNKDDFVNIFSEIEDDLYLLKLQDDIKAYMHIDPDKLHIGDLKDILKEDPNGAICFTHKGSEERLTNYVNSHYKDELFIRFYHNDRYAVSEIYPVSTSKGNALKKVIDYYHVPFEKTISIGDGHNDISMFEVTNIKVGMANGHPDLLKHANTITKAVWENGVYEFLKDFFYKED